MNKKFSTLLVSALLSVVGVGSVSAQSGGIELTQGKWSESIFQIAVAGKTDTVLMWKPVKDGKDSLILVDRNSVKVDSLGYTLWCGQVTEEAGNGSNWNGKQPVFDFINKATGKLLSVKDSTYKPDTLYDMELPGDTVLSEGWLGWSFSEGYNPVADSSKLFTYISKDSVVALVADSAKVKFKVIAAVDVRNSVQTGFSLVSPKPVVLNAAALMTKLGTADSAAFEFEFFMKGADIDDAIDPSTDVFKKKLASNPSTTSDGLMAVDYKDGLVFLMKPATRDTFVIKADSSWINGEEATGTRYMAWSDSTHITTFRADTTAGKKAQYAFRILYSPAVDSLIIKVDSAYYMSWPDSAVSLKHDTAYVTLQGLTEDTRYKYGVTISDSIHVTEFQIKLGFSGCAPYEPPAGPTVTNNSKEGSSIPAGLYTIQDSVLKKYYADPLHGNGDVRNWVEVDKKSQNVLRMPAYQWVINPIEGGVVVESKDAYNNVTRTTYTNAVTLENREFGVVDTLFFIKNYQSAHPTYHLEAIPGVNTDVDKALGEGTHLQIEEIDKTKHPEVYEDKYLGYYRRPETDIKYNLNRYIFRYFHPYALTDETARYLTFDEKFANGDSMLYVKNTKDKAWGGTPFELKSSNEEYKYGVGDTMDDTQWEDSYYNKKIEIVRLVRTPYVIARKEMVMDSIINKKYAMAHGVKVADQDSFYMKANNYYEAEGDSVDFYTIIKAKDTSTVSGVKKVTPLDVKAGVSDQNVESPLSVDELSTERSSAFSITPDNAPLYRRFNKEGDIWKFESDVKKAAGTDSLLFFEHYRKEYLMDETNESFNPKDPTTEKDIPPHYLGIWSKDKTNKLAFHVDSARVNRDEESRIKPQYLISVDRKEVGTVITYDTIPCEETNGSHIDKDGNKTEDPKQCVHAKIVETKIPGFERGKYLISYADSLSQPMDNPENVKYLDKSMKYLRVGFVDAIRRDENTDTLLILPVDYIDKLNKDEKFSYDKLKDDLKTRSGGEKYILHWTEGNEHRNYTWSFRYVEPEGVPFATEEGEDNLFLFESNGDVNIAPDKGAWLESLNGCLVLTDIANTEFVDFISGYPGALMFNVERKTDDIDYATDNEKIDAEGVTVIAGTGNVTISGAAGRRVVISNILGQVVANTVLTSDNATVAAPQGVVIVAVEGEAAVKAIVR